MQIFVSENGLKKSILEIYQKLDMTTVVVCERVRLSKCIFANTPASPYINDH